MADRVNLKYEHGRDIKFHLTSNDSMQLDDSCEIKSNDGHRLGDLASRVCVATIQFRRLFHHMSYGTLMDSHKNGRLRR